MSPFPLGIIASARVAAGGGAPVIDFTASATNGTDAATQTYSAVNLGTAHADRHVIVCIAWGSTSRALTSVTIGGVTATIDQVSATAAGMAAIVRAAVPTGATGDIVISWGGAIARSIIGVYATRAAVTVAATATLTGDGSSSAQAAAAITNPAGGHVIACGYTFTTALSWSASVTSDHASTVETVWGGSAHTTTTGALTITAGASTSNDAVCAVAYTL